jgi:Tol biopolymer transport system component
MNNVRRITLLLAALALFSRPAPAQYFGRNSVQYETFNFKILRTQHFDVYFYDKEAKAAAEAARMAERWYTRISTVLRHQLSSRQPLILYADHPDFEQTNVLGESPGEGTGGVTESLKRRIILPMGATLAESDHVIGHELVHAFQYDITGVGRQSMTGLTRVPLWFIEGMAEYLSIGPVDPNTTMWMRDAVRRGELPKFGDLEDFRYFPYRWGQAFWAYMGGTYGDDVVGALLRAAGRNGNVQLSLESMTHRPVDSLFADWHRALTAAAQEVAAATATELPTDKADVQRERARPVTTAGARLLVSPGSQTSHYNLAPAISPDGKRFVYMSDAGLFSIDMYLANAENGRIIRKLISSTRDPHLESMQFINSAGAWDMSGSRFVIGAVVTGRPTLRIVNGTNGKKIRDIRFASLGEIFNPTWSPDGKKIVFSSQVGGYTDLFVYDLDTKQLQRLTDDPYADLQPAWSPDGQSIAFVTDRFGTSLDSLSYAPYQLAVMSAQGGQITQMPRLSGAKHINPQWSPDGLSVYFIADPGGISNIYRLSLGDGVIRQVTNVFSGVSGITALSPALSVAQQAPRAVFSVYTGGGYAIQVIDDIQTLAGGQITELPQAAALLPPLDREVVGTGIAAALSDAQEGLPAETSLELADAVKAYHPKLSLDFIAEPSLAIAADRFGTYIGGGITLYWSDMLGDHNLVTMAQVNGRISDFAGLLAYGNRKSRLNWMIGAQWIPYITGQFGYGIDNNGNYVEQILRDKQTNRELSGIVAYPFNRSRRLEASIGVSQISFSRELRTTTYDFAGNVIDDRTEDLPAPGSLTLYSTTLGIVHDNSFFGATGPILGQRWRFEVDPTVGNLQFITALADYRRYIMFKRPFTLAGRVLHVGRYGRDGEDPRMYPLFIGYPTLVRGYDMGSFSPTECGPVAGVCPVFDQMVGSRIIVASAELRFPPFGLLGLGSGYYGILPVDAGIFYDAGVAWTEAQGAKILGARGPGARDVVRSAGISFRMNLLGYAIGQMDVVHPFNRPQKDWMVRFSLTQGF